jgi:hypothetical protein
MEHIVNKPVTYTLEDVKKLHWGFNSLDQVCAWGGLDPDPKCKEGDTVILIGNNFKLFSEVIISDDDGVMLNISSKFELDGVKYSTELEKIVFTPITEQENNSESQQETTTS